MNVRDLIPWNRGRDVTVRRGEETYPLLTLPREMNRLFDKVFRGFDLTSFGSERVLTRPNIEVSETNKEVKVRAELCRVSKNKTSRFNFRTASLQSKARRRPKPKTKIGCLASAITAALSAAFRLTTLTRTKSRRRSRTAF